MSVDNHNFKVLLTKAELAYAAVESNRETSNILKEKKVISRSLSQRPQ